jgi:hypothetical protein
MSEKVCPIMAQRQYGKSSIDIGRLPKCLKEDCALYTWNVRDHVKVHPGHCGLIKK